MKINIDNNKEKNHMIIYIEIKFKKKLQKNKKIFIENTKKRKIMKNKNFLKENYLIKHNRLYQ